MSKTSLKEFEELFINNLNFSSLEEAYQSVILANKISCVAKSAGWLAYVGDNPFEDDYVSKLAPSPLLAVFRLYEDIQ